MLYGFCLKFEFVVTGLPVLLLEECRRAIDEQLRERLGSFPASAGEGLLYGMEHVDFHLFTKDQLRVIYTWLRVVASALYGKALSKEINEIKETVKSAILEKNIPAGENQRLIKALRKKKVRRDNQM